MSGVPGGTDYPPADEGRCDALGLTDLGRALMMGAAERGIMLDVHQMSYRMPDDALALAEQQDFPLSASHAYLADLRGNSSERERTGAQIQRMVALGGSIAPITHQSNDFRPLPDAVTGHGAASRLRRDAPPPAPSEPTPSLDPDVPEGRESPAETPSDSGCAAVPGFALFLARRRR